MATRLQNQSFNVDFIDENPAISAFQKAEKFKTDQESAGLDIEGKRLTNDYNRSANPDRLRKLGAETSSSESTADVDYRTRDSKVAKSGADASTAVTNANVTAQTAPYKVDEAASSARTSRASADVTEGTVPFKLQDAESNTRTNMANADVASATVPDKIATSGQTLRQQRATAARTEMDNFHKTIEMLDQGNIEGAKQMAEAAGTPIPDAVLNDSRVRGAVISAAKRAKELYPDRPANQQAYISAQLGEIQQRIAAGQPNDRFTDFKLPPGAPEPVESSGSSQYDIVHRQETDPSTGQLVTRSYKFDKKGGELTPIEGTGAFGTTRNGGAGRDSVFQQRLKVGNSLYGEGSKEAADYANGRRQVTPGEAMRFGMQQAETELRNDPTIGNKFKNPTDRTTWKNNRAKEIATTISQSQTVAPPSAPAPAPAPPPAPTKSGSGLPPPGSVTGTQTVNVPTDMAGAGTRASPFVASTQQHVDWFKNNAPADAVIVINGQPYTRQ